MTDLPEPIDLSDEEYIENLRVIAGGTINALAENPEKLREVREGKAGLIIHSLGVDLITKWEDPRSKAGSN